MHDWNVVVTIHSEELTEVRKLLRPHGAMDWTDYYNVLVMKVANRDAFLSSLAASVDAEPGLLNFLSRAVPAEHTFDFITVEDFEAKARDCALCWVARLAGKSFHVRMHRRGFKSKLPSPREEKFLDDALLDALEETGRPGRISFDDPDAIIALETVGNRAGISLWTREDLRRYPFLGLD